MKKQVLIIEDEEIARRNLEYILEKEGYRVIAVDSGTKGLTLIKSRSSSEFILALTSLPSSRLPARSRFSW